MAHRVYSRKQKHFPGGLTIENKLGDSHLSLEPGVTGNPARIVYDDATSSALEIVDGDGADIELTVGDLTTSGTLDVTGPPALPSVHDHC